MQYFKTLFSYGPYRPHGQCFLWEPGLIALHVISDLLITLSHLSIPFTLAYFVSKRRDHPFHWIFTCFAGSSLVCGSTHGVKMHTPWPANRPRVQSHVRGSGLEVTVHESGTDVNPRHLRHVFDTFFTTKPPGKDMGLYIIRSIIEAHNGRLWASPDRAGQGAAFHCSLPTIACAQP